MAKAGRSPRGPYFQVPSATCSRAESSRNNSQSSVFRKEESEQTMGRGLLSIGKSRRNQGTSPSPRDSLFCLSGRLKGFDPKPHPSSVLCSERKSAPTLPFLPLPMDTEGICEVQIICLMRPHQQKQPLKLTAGLCAEYQVYVGLGVNVFYKEKQVFGSGRHRHTKIRDCIFLSAGPSLASSRGLPGLASKSAGFEFQINNQEFLSLSYVLCNIWNMVKRRNYL